MLTHLDPTAPYQVFIAIHGTGGSGAAMREFWEPILRKHAVQNVFALFPTFEIPFQFLVPDLDTQLIRAYEQAVAVSGIRTLPKWSLFGYSGGAQFCQRFTYRHPKYVGVCAALSAGGWTTPDGVPIGMMTDEKWYECEPWNTAEITRVAREPANDGVDQVRWIIGCGAEDHPSRSRSAVEFADALEQYGSLVDRIEFGGTHDEPDSDLSERTYWMIRLAELES